MDFTASVEDNGACRMHPLDAPSVQAAKPKSAKTRMRLTPTVPRGCSATPMTMDGSSPIHHRAPSRTRTGNTRIRSPLLYPLSYRGNDQRDHTTRPRCSRAHERNRTSDTRFRRAALYPLSYVGNGWWIDVEPHHRVWANDLFDADEGIAPSPVGSAGLEPATCIL